jgi:putative two-component system response regulator
MILESHPDAVALPGSQVDASLAACRVLHGQGRSAEALPLARAALEQCEPADHQRTIRAATACGLLSGDTGDLVGAIEYHVRALRVAGADENRVEMSRTWNNIGHTIGISGNFALAARCYQRALALVEPHPEPVYSRFAACCNLADCHFQLGDVEQGLQFGSRALRELTPAFQRDDPYAVVLLRRNLARLLILAGDLPEAHRHVNEAIALAKQTPTPRTQIAADITLATYELAAGNTDVALTRLEQVLGRSRALPSTLRDTLVCVIRGEEMAGHAGRALMRLEELSNHIYNLALERSREHLELAGLRAEPLQGAEAQVERYRAHLMAKLAPRSEPEGWKTLQRLAVGAIMRVDDTGWHGRRVGALTKALALASGTEPLKALEMGLAAELHDIGLLSVPEAILAKRSALSLAERSLVQRHAEAGAAMLRDDSHPTVLLAREIATYHHARWDGKGYPGSVKGKFIPLGARICAVADAYDAMVCGVGHQGPRDMADALAELRRESGRQFDPELVTRFDALIRSESEDLGVDIETGPGMKDFQDLVAALKDDRGFV